MRTEEIAENLEILKRRNLKDANNFHIKGDTKMEEICMARADAYQTAIDILNGKISI